MAFIRANFQPIGGQSRRGIGGAPAVWSYKTADAHATVDNLDYFASVAGLLSIGDIIIVAVVTNLGASNEALSTFGWHAVKDKASASSVDVTNVTVGLMTDSD